MRGNDIIMGTTIPSSELRFWLYKNRRGDMIFQMTSNPTRTRYYLYEATPDGWRKLGSAKTPPELEAKYHVDERTMEG